uniref:Adenosine deaminase n=1 Tax=Strombidium rassoulzadegani TaxID=1082188 RepID=A0A7S3CMS7_9SPIT|mmetsp:Transcript_17481/g.29423  ORF Transcript_17481/g.29423 Transcript_17481/m.29423 type:complete len:491 (+) Transcript_17481:49-1521(+)
MTTKADMIKKHTEMVEKLKRADDLHRFSHDLEGSLSEDEKKANLVFVKLREEIANNETLNQTIHNYFEYKDRLQASKFYAILDKMPKGGVHHIHSLAAHCLDVFIDITKDDRVYFSDKFKKFKVFTKAEFVEEGYQRCNDMRKFFSDPQHFDDKLRESLVLNEKTVYNSSSSEIWKSFQTFFDQFANVTKFATFTRRLIRNLFESLIKQNVLVVEIRHTPGMYYDDDMKHLSFKEEMTMIHEVILELQKSHPHFRAKVILCGMKMLGNQHIEKIFAEINQFMTGADEQLKQLITGFDLVDEEDFSPQIQEFAKSLIANQKLTIVSCGKEQNTGIQFMLHSGETHDRNYRNLHDAIAIGTKRIGHGFQLFLFPELVKEVKERQICVEVCPLSNHLLGHTRDLRSHPLSYLINQGVQISISSDDPGYFGYEGVTLDYIYAAGAWMLDLQDIKKISLNGLNFSTVSSEDKLELLKVFNQKWNEWIKLILELPN